MEPNAQPPREGRTAFPFPTLPIVTPDPPRLTQREKYGGLFVMGLVGLAAVVGLVGWFAYGAWSLRHVWSNVYVLHDDHRPEADRVRAAFALSRDPRVNQRQYWDMCLRRPLPPLARYLLAESLTAEAASADPRGYALSVSRSPDWPDWLRLLLTRPMAYAAVDGRKFPREPLDELTRHRDPAIALWAAFVLAQVDPNDRQGSSKLDEGCRQDGPERELACLLLESDRLRGRPSAQKDLLDRATLWLRLHHPESVRVWSGWRAEGGRIVREPASELH